MRPIDLLLIKTYHGISRLRDIGKALGVNEITIRYHINKHNIKKAGDREYAVYYGDHFLMTGTKDQIMSGLDMPEATFAFAMTEKNRNRINNDSNAYVVVDLGFYPFCDETFDRNNKMLEKVFGKRQLKNLWEARERDRIRKSGLKYWDVG